MKDDVRVSPWRLGDRQTELLAGAYFLAFLVLWVVVPVWTHEQPSSDNYEQIDWASQPAWGYSKHPPLPSLILWAFGKVFPLGLPLTYALGGLDVAVMLTAAFLLTRETLDRKRAWMAVLFISCIIFYGGRLHYYNHNMALLAAYAVSIYCLNRALRSASHWWWCAVGVCWALGMLSKYQMVVGIASSLIVVWQCRTPGSHRWLLGPVLAGVTAGLLLLPHLVWLVNNDFPPFHYAAKFVAAGIPWLDRPSNVAHFVVNQLGRLGPLIAVIGVLFWIGARRYRAQPGAPPVEQSANGRRMLEVHAWAPHAMMIFMSLGFGTDLELHWGTAFLWLLPPWFLTTASGRSLARIPLPATLAVVALAQSIMLMLSAFAGI